jgi:hypothetical protein
MPIEKNDRSFDKIFDEVDLINVPSKYILSVLVTFTSNESLEFESLEHATSVIQSLDDSIGVLDISVKLDHDTIRDEVTTEIKNKLGQFFKDE